MKSARLVGPKNFEFVDVETPVPSDGQCLIKLERVSVQPQMSSLRAPNDLPGNPR